MKIKTKTLITFFKKVSLGNTIEEFVADFSDKGLQIVAKNNTNTSVIKAFLPIKSFVEYEVLGKIGFQQLSKIIKILAFLGDETIFNIEGNMLIFKGDNNKIETESMNIESVNPVEFKELPLDDCLKIELNPEVLNELVNNSSTVNKDYNIELSTKLKMLKIKTTGGFRFTKTFNIDSVDREMTTFWGTPLIDAFNYLDSNIVFHIKPEYPAFIREESEESVINIIVAPRLSQ